MGGLFRQETRENELPTWRVPMGCPTIPPIGKLQPNKDLLRALFRNPGWQRSLGPRPRHLGLHKPWVVMATALRPELGLAWQVGYKATIIR